MRLSLKRQPRPDQPRKPLRDRLAETKGRLAAVSGQAKRLVEANRLMLSKRDLLLSGPRSETPAVDRIALINYATFLDHERYKVCAELYPHMGRKAVAFVLTLNAADRFFYRDDADRRLTAPPASTRALKVLDAVGIDWREDTDEHSRRTLDGDKYPDTGERPVVPFGWPDIDSPITGALDDLTRLDAAIRALGEGNPGRDLDDVPGIDALEEARDAALERLAKERAQSLLGLQAKSRALLTPVLSEVRGDDYGAIVASLARDLLCLPPRAIEPKPDPIFAAIEEGRRLLREHGRLHAICGSKPNDDPSWEPEHEAHCDLWLHVGGSVLKTVPATAAGCVALAQFAVEFTKDQGVPLDSASSSNDPVLALIARSPLL